MKSRFSTFNNCTLAMFAIVMVLSLSTTLWGAGQPTLATVGGVIEISGGSVRQPWKLRYSLRNMHPGKVDETHLAIASGERAYFSHGPWLRLLDSKQGIVIGRWLLPGVITQIEPVAEGAKIEIARDTNNHFKETFLFDPAHPQIPAGANALFVAYLLSENEVVNLFLQYQSNNLYLPIKIERAHELIPEIREAVRRDPLSPWFRVLLGKVLLDTGDPSATAVFEDAIHLPLDYTELLRLSSFFENYRQFQLADESFERGYHDWLQRGNDPRMFSGLPLRFALYPIDFKKIDPKRMSIVHEHLYQIIPYGEYTELAWDSYALSASTPQERLLWQSRARETRQRTLHIFAPLLFQFDIALLVGFASQATAWFFVIVSYVRYRQQRFADKESFKLNPVPLRTRIYFFNIQYWSMSQRIGMVLVYAIFWFCSGWGIQSLSVAWQLEMPISAASGNYSGPEAQAFFQKSLQSGPERDFLLALSMQQGGNSENAARLYQQAPQYAESWNNLGVIWKSNGNEAEANKAFERALQQDANLAEAEYNLGRTPSDYWTKLHERYLPGTPMPAAPPQHLFMRAYIGGSAWDRFRQAWITPFKPMPIDGSMNYVKTAVRRDSLIETLAWLAFCLLVLLVVLPRRPVERPAGRIGNALAVLFPGTAREWGCLGGVVLLSWMFLLWQVLALKMFGSPYIMTFIATPNLMRTYGASDSAMELLNPTLKTLCSGLVILFLINLWVVSKSIRMHRLPSTTF